VLVANIAVFGHELRVGAITWKSFEKFFLLFSVVWYVAPRPASGGCPCSRVRARGGVRAWVGRMHGGV